MDLSREHARGQVDILSESESEPESSFLRRFGCAVVAHQGRIYVGGGFGEDKAILCSVESYDPDTDKVSPSPPIPLYSSETY